MALAEADMTTTGIMYDGQNNRNFADEKLLVKFFVKPRKNERASTKEGRPIFDELVYISIKVPGSKSAEVIRPIRETDKVRFPEHYAAFENHGIEEHITGTPLDAWPPLSKSQIEELRFFNVRTVEQLADLSDTHTTNFRAIASLRQKARLYIEASQGGAPLEALQSEMEEKDNEIATMKQALEEQGGMIAKLEAKLED